MTEALAIATGRGLLGVLPDEPVNVWYWNGEDPMEELQRRLAAACVQYSIPAEEWTEGSLLTAGANKRSCLPR